MWPERPWKNENCDEGYFVLIDKGNIFSLQEKLTISHGYGMTLQSKQKLKRSMGHITHMRNSFNQWTHLCKAMIMS